jgi:uncharacterized protein with ParB-like and HNH nuclease domain
MSIKEKFTAESLSIVELFRGCSYVVPAFQRDYAWTEEQCSALWDDINSVNRESENFSIDLPYDHFLGPMVVIEEKNRDGGEPNKNYSSKFLVIDGQQRLTTLQMILALLSDRWRELGVVRNTSSGPKPAFEICESLINSGAPYYEFTFTPNLYIRENFKKYIQNATTRRDQKFNSISDVKRQISDLSHHEELFLAYLYFKDQILKLTEKQLGRLEETLLSSIFVLRINAGTISNAFVLFDTLNNRGLDLTQGDLLKNHIFKMTESGVKADLSPEVSSRLAKWDSIVEDVGYKRLDNFLRYFLIIKKRNKVQRESIMSIIQAEYDTSAKISDLLKELDEFAGYYTLIERDNLFEGTNSDALNLLFTDLSDLGQSTQAIFLMAALKRFSGYSSRDEFESLCVVARSAEILSFRWLICGKNAQDLENIWVEGVKALLDKELDNEEAVARIRKDLKAQLPADEELKKEFESRIIRSSKFARYILKKFELGEIDSKTWVLAGSSALDVEHIAPRTADLEGYWKKSMDGPLNYSAIVNCIGNQILLSKGPNRSAKNKPFPIKKSYYKEREGKDLPVTSRFILEESNWKQNDILRRGKKMGQEATRIWDWHLAEQSIQVKKLPNKRSARKTTKVVRKRRRRRKVK